MLKINRDNRAILTAARNEGLEEGRQEGRQKGIAEGKQKTQEEIVKRLLSLGIPHDTICKAAGILPEEFDPQKY